MRDPHLFERIKARCVVDPETGCWNWQGALNRKGYGKVQVSGRTMDASRAVFVAVHGEPEPGICACHSCDNRRCCNPDHLWPGTKGDNTRDMDAKGRRRTLRGSENPRATLTEDAVRAIRRAFANGLETQRAIARRFGVSKSLLGRIVHGQVWRHVALLCLALSTACTPLADRACDELDTILATERIVLDLNRISGTCHEPYLRFVTTAPGSLELDGCTHIDEPERYACGLAFHFSCPAGVLDNASTPGTWEVVGSLEIDDPRDGPVGLADVTLWADHGTGEAWAVCGYEAEVDAWVYELE